MRPFLVKSVWGFSCCQNYCSFEVVESMGLNQRFELNGWFIVCSQCGHWLLSMFKILFHMVYCGNRLTGVRKGPQSIHRLLLLARNSGMSGPGSRRSFRFVSLNFNLLGLMLGLCIWWCSSCFLGSRCAGMFIGKNLPSVANVTSCVSDCNQLQEFR